MTSQTLSRPLVALALAATLTTAGCRRADGPGWPQWRGGDGSGVSRTAAALPTTWSETAPNVRWKSAVPGLGFSSPVVAGGRVYVTSAVERDAGGALDRTVVALDLDSGARLWQTTVETAPGEPLHEVGSWATPTPAFAGGRLYAYFGSTLAALDATGAVVWSRLVDPAYPTYSRYGAASSPIVHDGRVFLFQDREFGDTKDAGWVAAFDAATGEPLWRHEWMDTCCSYVTPLLISREGAAELVLFLSQSVAAYDPASGERIWSYANEIIQPVPSPVYGDGVLALLGGIHKQGGQVLRLAGRGATTTVEALWENEREIPGTASPLLLDGLLYSVTENGILSCRRAATGERLWRKRLPLGNYRASLAAGDGKLYAASSRGVTSVVATGERFETLGENTLDGEINASPALVGGSLILRTGTHLYRIDGPSSH